MTPSRQMRRPNLSRVACISDRVVFLIGLTVSPIMANPNKIDIFVGAWHAKPVLPIDFTFEPFVYNDIIPSPGIATLRIFPPAGPGTYAAASHAPGRDADCTIEALQRITLPTRIGTTDKLVGWTERQASPGTFGGSLLDSQAVLRVYRFAAGLRLFPSQPRQRVQAGQSLLLPRLNRGPTRRVCGSPDTRMSRNQWLPTGLVGLPTVASLRVHPGSRAARCLTCRLLPQTGAITSYYQ